MSLKIDFVILWVDGNEEHHRSKSAAWLDKEKSHYNYDREQSTSDFRFVQHDELLYCLRSIKQNAPWYNKIWLVTDDQTPSFLNHEQLHKDKIEVVDHLEIFKGFECYLPTFNTRAIASLIYRIPGLSEHFIYGNDDFMIGSPVDETFFFKNKKPVIYGDWMSCATNDRARLHRLGIIKGAQIINNLQEQFLHTSHGFYPLIKSKIAYLHTKYQLEFINNLKYKFRHKSQFLIESLFNHYCVKNNIGELFDTTMFVHFSNELCREGRAEKIDFLFELINSKQRKVFCINDFGSLIRRYPSLIEYLNNLVSMRLYCENKVIN